MGKIHKYLEMMLDYSSKGEVRINVRDYVQGIIGTLPEEMIGLSQVPAATNLFETCEQRQ